MKDYSLKINGHNYSVQIDDVNEASTVAHVVVNGVDYEVEIEGAKASTVSKPQVAPAPKSANSAMITPQLGDSLAAHRRCRPFVGVQREMPPAGHRAEREGRRWRYDRCGTDARRARSHEDGEQHRRGPRRRCQAGPRAAGRYGNGRRCVNRNRVGVCGVH